MTSIILSNPLPATVVASRAPRTFPAVRPAPSATAPAAPPAPLPVDLSAPTSADALLAFGAQQGQRMGALGIFGLSADARFFDSAPLPHRQQLGVGQTTGYHRVRLDAGRTVADSSDAVVVPVKADLLRTTLTEWTGRQPERTAQKDAAHRPVTVWTWRAALHVDVADGIREPAGEMRIHVVERGNGTSVLQIDWRALVLADGAAWADVLLDEVFPALFARFGVERWYRGPVAFEALHPALARTGTRAA
jgi:hypothetical protein